MSGRSYYALKELVVLTLGIETSCDETACAVLENSGTLRSSVVSSSLSHHAPFGGIVPEIASRHCLEVMPVVFQEALRKAKCSADDLSLISVTYGPGLIGSLFVGVSFAKALSFGLSLPLVGVNHLHAHVYANFIARRIPNKAFLGLVVSGGHTSIVYCRNGVFEECAMTRDDACGEAFDKVAKLLGMGFPGGPAIERMAQKGCPTKIPFKCGQFKNSHDFSFSGIKTAVLYYTQKRKKQVIKRELPDICASFQECVLSDIVKKTIDVAIVKKVRLIVVGGGVSANGRLRTLLSERAKRERIKVFFPECCHSIDNAAMVARYGYELYKDGVTSDMRLTAVPGLGM